MEGLEAKELLISQLIDNRFRIDAEYYQKKYLELAKKIELFNPKTINKLHVKLDCSAFYPSIVSDYNFEFNGIPFLRVDDIKAGFVSVTNNTAFLLPKVLDTNHNTIAKAYPGDILIAKGGNTLGKIGLLTEEYPEYSICRDVLLLRTSVLDDSIRYYLWSFLNSIHGYNLLFRTASQTGQPHLTLASIAEIKVPTFGMEFKVIYKKLFHKIEILKKKSELLYVQSEHIVLNELGLLQLNITKSNQNIKSLKNSFLSTGRLDAEYYQPKYDILFNHLNGIETKKLGSIVNIKKSIEPGSDAYQDSGIPFVRVSNISKFGLMDTEIYLNANKYSNEELYPKKDSILLSKDGSVGIAYKIEEDMKLITSGALLHLNIIDDEFLPDYLTLVLNSQIVQLQAERDAGGSIIQHWKPSEIEEVIIPKLPLDNQKKISDLIQESFKLKKQSKQLLDIAKKAVEIAIEQDEVAGIDYINSYSELMQKDRKLH